MFWPGIGLDGFNLLLGWLESVFGNDVTQVDDLRLALGAFGQVDFEFGCTESFQDLPEMVEMFCEIGRLQRDRPGSI